MSDKIKNIVGMILVLLCLVINITQADQIDRYDSNITVLEDGTIDVVETIQISTNHEEIKLGITRDIPTHYYFMNKEVETPVNVLSVMRNGKPENFWTQNNDGYVEIFTGSVDNVVDNYLDKGPHTFIIHWQSKNHIRSFENYDELYINAIGHNWHLPINNAIVTLNLPKSVEAIQSTAYYGAEGRTDQIKSIQQSPQKIQFKAPEILGNGKGFTVATGFTKGIVPSIKANQLDIVVDRLYGSLPSYIHPFNVVLIIITLILLTYYFAGRFWHHRLSSKNTRVFTVRFSPPNLSLSQIFALLKPNNDSINQGVLAVLLDMHVKKIIHVQPNEQTIILGPNAENTIEDDVQKVVISTLNQKKKSISFQNDSRQWGKVISKMSHELEKLNEETYKVKMLWHWLGVFPLLVGLIAVSVVFFFIPFELYFALVFMVIALLAMWLPSFKNIACSYQGQSGESVKKTFQRSLPFLLMGAIFSLVPLIFMLFETNMKKMSDSDVLIIYVLLIVTILIIRKILLKTYSLIYFLSEENFQHQQSIMEFKHFLQYTKEEQYQLITPDLFEQYLPYSILFGVEKQWIKRYEHLYPTEFMNSQIIVLMNTSHNSISQSVNSASFSSSAPSSNYGGSSFGSGGSGSGGGGSSGGGSGGGGGGGR